MSNDQSDRSDLVELQTRIAYIEDTMRAIDVRMIEHQNQIDRLEVWCKDIARRMRNASPSNDDHEVPPHY